MQSKRCKTPAIVIWSPPSLCWSCWLRHPSSHIERGFCCRDIHKVMFAKTIRSVYKILTELQNFLLRPKGMKSIDNKVIRLLLSNHYHYQEIEDDVAVVGPLSVMKMLKFESLRWLNKMCHRWDGDGCNGELDDAPWCDGTWPDSGHISGPATHNFTPLASPFIAQTYSHQQELKWNI